MSRNNQNATINRRVNSVAEYLKNKTIKAGFMQRIKPSGDVVFVIKGKEFGLAEIHAQFPTDMDLKASHNSDRSQSWIVGKKSY